MVSEQVDKGPRRKGASKDTARKGSTGDVTPSSSILGSLYRDRFWHRGEPAVGNCGTIRAAKEQSDPLGL